MTVQNCRPQMVNFAMSTSTVIVMTAAMAQARAIQINESTNALPQSIENEKGSSVFTGHLLRIRRKVWPNLQRRG